MIALAVVALGLRMTLWELRVPEYLSLYNSGVYFTASLHAVSGLWPYRDFTFVQPPGIVYLMLPAAIVGRLTTSADGFTVARIITAVVTALNAGLLAWLLRRYGRTAMAIAGCLLALLPVTSLVGSTVMLEPYSVFFVLLGANLLLSRDRRSWRRVPLVVAGGIMLGVAVLVKLWAVLPVFALVVALVRRRERRLATVVTSATATFVALALPFVLAAPRAFLSEVITEQLSRRANPQNQMSLALRLVNLTGFGTTVPPPGRLLAGLTLAIVVAVVFTAYRRGPLGDLDLFLLLSTAGTFAALLWSSEFYSYYAYFSAPFLVGLVAVSLARLGPGLRRGLVRFELSAALRRFLAWSAAFVAAVSLAGMVVYSTNADYIFSWAYGTYGPWLAAIDRYVPPGSCVVYSDPAYGVLTNRLALSPTCPDVVDPDGLWLAWGDQRLAPAPAFVAQWHSTLARARFTVLESPVTRSTSWDSPGERIPWDRGLAGWFLTHYRLVEGDRNVFIYENDAWRS